MLALGASREFRLAQIAIAIGVAVARARLRLNDAGHTNLFFGPEGALLNEGVLSFLDEHIRGIPGSQINIANFVAFTGLGEWRQR